MPSTIFATIIRTPAMETQVPSPQFLPPEVLKGVTLNAPDESHQHLLLRSGCVSRQLPRSFTRASVMFYEIAAFCPAFNANRAGEIRSEQRRACPFCSKPAPGSADGKTLKGPH